MQQLNTRERFVRTLLGQEVDRAPFMRIFGGDNHMLGPWRQKYPGLSYYMDELLGFEGGYRGWRCTPVNMGLYGVEPEIILCENEHEKQWKTGDGTVWRMLNGGENRSMITKYPVADADDWDRIKEKYLSAQPEKRLPPDWKFLCELYQNRDFPLQLTCGGVYGFMRNMMGDEALCYAMYDEPELVKDISGTYIDMCIGVWERMCADVQFDLIECWEDMASKDGALISPAFFEEFMAPHYRRIRAFADAHHIPIVLVDSDGKIDKLAHLMTAVGVNAMYPFEVGAGCQPLSVLRQLPNMAALGCLEKNACALGEAAIDAEMEKARALIRNGRCIPGPDHIVLENVTFEGYKMFMNKLRDVIMNTKPGT